MAQTRRTRWTIIGCLVVIVALAGFAAHRWDEAANHEAVLFTAQEKVRALGGSWSVDLVDGNYVINLNSPDVTDDDIAQLVPLFRRLTADTLLPLDYERIFAFDLSGTKVSDDGVKALSQLPLAWLNLAETAVTDQSLLHLRRQDRLRLVTITKTSITTTAAADLQESLPRLWVFDADRAP